jgi:thioredoxin 1
MINKDNIMNINDKDFLSEVVLSRNPVVVEFYTDWSGSCHIIEPIIEELSCKYEGKIKFTRMNLEKNNEIPKSYNIIFLPTLLYFLNGVLQNQDLGVVSRDDVEEKLISLLQLN